MPSIYIYTQGCSANLSDSEAMSGILLEKGYSLTDLDHADLIIINTCTVKGPTESEFKRKLSQFQSFGKPIVLAGCIPQSQPQANQVFPKIGTNSLHKLPEVVEAALHGSIKSEISRSFEERLSLPIYRNNPLIAIVPISQGCLSNCTFCKTKQARGNLHSYTPNEIMRHISSSVSQGVKEIWLTSQDCSAYGYDLGSDLANLLEKILSIKRTFKIRVGMANPGYFAPFLKNLLRCYQDDRVYQFLHIPLQSGNNQVLKEMSRDHTVDDYLRVTESFLKKFPDITIATDIICGYPTETPAQFRDSLDVITRSKPSIMNISRFWPRPGTPAAKLKPLKGDEVRARTIEMMKLHKNISLQQNKRWIGWQGKVFFSEMGKKGSFIGKNFAYKQVIAHSQENILGKEATVNVVEATPIDLRAELISH